MWNITNIIEFVSSTHIESLSSFWKIFQRRISSNSTTTRLKLRQGIQSTFKVGVFVGFPKEWYGLLGVGRKISHELNDWCISVWKQNEWVSGLDPTYCTSILVIRLQWPENWMTEHSAFHNASKCPCIRLSLVGWGRRQSYSIQYTTVSKVPSPSPPPSY